jgi:hypothetical protein
VSARVTLCVNSTKKKKNEIVAVRGKERVVAFFEEEISFFFVLFLSL